MSVPEGEPTPIEVDEDRAQYTSPERPQRRRLRPLRADHDMREEGSDSPEPMQPNPPKTARTADTEMNALQEDLLNLEKEAQNERVKVNQRMLMMVIKGVEISEIYSPPRSRNGSFNGNGEWEIL